jgi:hypothetical protein
MLTGGPHKIDTNKSNTDLCNDDDDSNDDDGDERGDANDVIYEMACDVRGVDSHSPTCSSDAGTTYDITESESTTYDKVETSFHTPRPSNITIMTHSIGEDAKTADMITLGKADARGGRKDSDQQACEGESDEEVEAYPMAAEDGGCDDSEQYVDVIGFEHLVTST